MVGHSQFDWIRWQMITGNLLAFNDWGLRLNGSQMIHLAAHLAPPFQPKRTDIMTRYLLSLPIAAMMCGAGFAETTTTATDNPATSDSMYGTTWSKSTGAMFYSDPEMKMMRTPEEIGASWTTLSQADRDAVLAECVRYRTDSGTTAAMGTDAESTTGTGGDTAEAATGAETTATTEGTTTDGTAPAQMGVSAESMKQICDLAEAY